MSTPLENGGQTVYLPTLNAVLLTVSGEPVEQPATPPSTSFTEKQPLQPAKILALILTLLSLLTPLTALAFTVPDSGHKKCYNGTVEITCPQPGEAFYGQDGNYAVPPRSYTKLEANGKDLAAAATTWAMVRDNVTKLIWEAKTDDGGIHDKDNTYTWCDSKAATNGGNAGTCGNGTDTEDFITALNTANFGGHADWRLPTIKELASLAKLDVAYPGPVIDSGYFPQTQSSSYWSATTSAYGTNDAWYVYFVSGDGSLSNKSNSYYVRAVRSGQ